MTNTEFQDYDTWPYPTASFLGRLTDKAPHAAKEGISPSARFVVGPACELRKPDPMLAAHTQAGGSVYTLAVADGRLGLDRLTQHRLNSVPEAVNYRAPVIACKVKDADMAAALAEFDRLTDHPDDFQHTEIPSISVGEITMVNVEPTLMVSYPLSYLRMLSECPWLSVKFIGESFVSGVEGVSKSRRRFTGWVQFYVYGKETVGKYALMELIPSPLHTFTEAQWISAFLELSGYSSDEVNIVSVGLPTVQLR